MLLIAVVLLLLFILGPQWWVRHVLNKYNVQQPEMPGTGGELARHLLDRLALPLVAVEATDEGADHYDPEANCVRLSPSYLNGKSLTAIVVAAHEVGHAIQFNRQEPVSFLRRRYLGSAHRVQKTGIYCLMALPLISTIFRLPPLVGLMALAGIVSLLASVLIYAAVLPEEWDASFNKALPILAQGEYVATDQIPASRRILKACALTYVAAALADILRFWRWIALLKMLR